ncbi:MAG TPA: hypothetical protein VE178_17090 [Silvibacterium sp.]|jgi:hypothetical protein|nr:hypothetical protein [Silvibacterium sp.]
MKLSALLLLSSLLTGAFTRAGVAQSNPAPSPSQNLTVDDQALSRAAAAVAASARAKDLQKMMDRVSRANCPVVLTSAWLTPRLQLLKSDEASGGNGIDLVFQNASGKEIRSMELSATILVKKSIYDLGYLPPVHLSLTAYGTRNIDSAFAELRRLSLPTEIHPALVESIRLEQVTFEDGSVWSSGTDQYCGLTPDPMRSIAR